MGQGSTIGSEGLERWRNRNLALYDALLEAGWVDAQALPLPALEHLLKRLLQQKVKAATESYNAAHLQAQNDNLICYGLAVGAAPKTFSCALAGGMIHDLNKALGEKLRTDHYRPQRQDGTPFLELSTEGEVIAFNHLGRRTLDCLIEASQLSEGALPKESVELIDQTIVHHGLGSSAFITALVEGRLDWWTDDFRNSDKTARFLHPEQPPLHLASVIHDLADSTQQMQAGTAWMLKYPLGHWKNLGLSYQQLLLSKSGHVPAMGLQDQLQTETETCQQIMQTAQNQKVIDRVQAMKLSACLGQLTASTAAWVRPEDEEKEGMPHLLSDLEESLGCTKTEAVELLKNYGPMQDNPDLLAALMSSAQKLDAQRAVYLGYLLPELEEEFLSPTV